MTARAANASIANGKAIYVTTKDPAGNSMIVMNVEADTTLSQGSTTATGDIGMSGIDTRTNQSVTLDVLFSSQLSKSTVILESPQSGLQHRHYDDH